MKKFIIILILSFLSTISYSGEIYRNMKNLVFLLHFDEGTGLGTQYSTSTVKTVATLGITAYWVRPTVNSSTASPSGSNCIGILKQDANSNVLFTLPNFPSGSNPVTVTCWIHLDSSTALCIYRRTVYEFCQRTNAFSIQFYNGLGKGDLGFTDGNTIWYFSQPIYNTDYFVNQWKHITLTYINPIVTLFINGQVKSSVNVGVLNTGTNGFASAIGTYADGDANNSFTGAIDEVAVFNVALSTATIRKIYSKTRGKYE